MISDRDGSDASHWFAAQDVDSGAIKRCVARHDAALLGSQLVVTPSGLIVAPHPKRGYVIARMQ